MNLFNTKLRTRSVALVAITALAGVSSFALVSAMQSANNVVEVPQSTAGYVAAVPNIPAEQRAALADGVVTYDEHEAAIQRTIACATAAGVRMEVTPGSGLRTSQLGFVSRTPEENLTSKQQLETCVELHLKHIELGHVAEPVGPGVIADASARLVACMEGAGATGFDAATVRTTIDVLVTKRERTKADYDTLKAWDKCRMQVEEAIGFRP